MGSQVREERSHLLPFHPLPSPPIHPSWPGLSRPSTPRPVLRVVAQNLGADGRHKGGHDGEVEVAMTVRSRWP